MTSIIVHGHFYQPPRENPWTGAIDGEESARPYHDWNERIAAECYRPNAFARVVNGAGQVEYIVNNYANLSFNFGSTLMSWLEGASPQTYARIVEADRESVRRRCGHGNAIAQGYNHAILPLCNERDRLTQIRWGVADFRHRFGREPEALWLPETACNDATMGALIDEGMKFAVLSPHQAERVRTLGAGADEWRSVADGTIDPRLPYRYFHRDGSGRSLAVFFYDAAVAREVAFENLLSSSQQFVTRLESAAAGGPLVNVATDGESYGHHYHFGDRCLAYGLEFEASRRHLKVTNYGAFLEEHPPRDEIEIKPGPGGEGTSWSCAHGVGRWYRACGCSTGGQPGWNQEWRGPLRTAFDLLRDQAARIFEERGTEVLRDPWRARDCWVDVILTRGAARESFLARHARRGLREAATLRALRLLEMQRNAMLMYTSCGWFFAELSGLETVQVLKYAARTMDLMRAAGAEVPELEFLEVLSRAKSNLPEMGNGADVYRRFVPGCRVTPQRAAAHLAISSLASQTRAREGRIGDYGFHEEGVRQERHGRLTLATSRVAVIHAITDERHEFASAALHLGGVDFYCALKPFASGDDFRQATERIWERFRKASLPAIIRSVQEEFGPNEYGLEDVLVDGRVAICQMIFAGMLEGLTSQFSRLYEEYHRVVEMLQESGFEAPPQFRQLTEFTLGRQFEQEIVRQQQSRDPNAYQRAAEIARVVAKRGYKIDRSAANASFGAMITDAVRIVLKRPSPAILKSAAELIALARRLGLEPDLDRAQESVYCALAAGSQQATRLSRLAAALGLSPAAIRRLRPARSRPGVRRVAAQPAGARIGTAQGARATGTTSAPERRGDPGKRSEL